MQDKGPENKVEQKEMGKQTPINASEKTEVMAQQYAKSREKTLKILDGYINSKDESKAEMAQQYKDEILNKTVDPGTFEILSKDQMKENLNKLVEIASQKMESQKGKVPKWLAENEAKNEAEQKSNADFYARSKAQREAKEEGPVAIDKSPSKTDVWFQNEAVPPKKDEAKPAKKDVLPDYQLGSNPVQVDKRARKEDIGNFDDSDLLKDQPKAKKNQSPKEKGEEGTPGAK